LKINNPFILKHKRVFLAVAVLTLCLAVGSSSYAIASYVWGGTITSGDPLHHPTLTDTFSVTAKINGTSVSDPTAIVIPSGFYAGDSYVVIYKITNTANQPLLITPNNSGTPASWDQQSVVIPMGSTVPITLTIPNIQSAVSITVSFTPSSAS
jgi:hypothetical protein